MGLLNSHYICGFLPLVGVITDQPPHGNLITSRKVGDTTLRQKETYTDPNRYVKVNDELVWDRSFGRVHNTITLPEGWWLTANAIPATVFLNEAGLVSLYYLNDWPDDIDVFVKAMKR